MRQCEKTIRKRDEVGGGRFKTCIFDLVFQEVNVEGTKLLQACLPCSYAQCSALKLDAEAQYPQIWMVPTRMPVSYFARAASLARSGLVAIVYHQIG